LTNVALQVFIGYSGMKEKSDVKDVSADICIAQLQTLLSKGYGVLSMTALNCSKKRLAYQVHCNALKLPHPIILCLWRS